MIVEGKQKLELIIRQLSKFGMATGLQEMIVSCEKVGQGSFAQVYKVITNYNSVMALKAFDRKNLKIHKNKLAFHNEIDIMRSLQSKYIAAVDGLFQTQKNIYLKMQYFSISLKHFIKKNISIRTQKKIMKQLFQALLEMKNKNIVHRDLKPDNFMIRGKHQKTMQCVIIDFGLATPVNLDKYIFNRCGTPGFLAPQIAIMSLKGQKLTPACDMFSLGCIFYKTLTKKYIFSALNYNQVIQKNKKIVIPWQTFQSFSQNERDLLKKMLEKDPSKRILPQQALVHPYFIEQIDDEDQISHEQCDLIKKMKSYTFAFQSLTKKQSLESLMSSFNSNSNVELDGSVASGSRVYQQKMNFKDSCLSFQGPVKKSDTQLKNTDFKQQTQKTNRGKRRASRFSQINHVPIL